MPRPNKSDNDGLNMKQRKFVNAYCETGNATESAIKAGYEVAGAHVQGSRLLKNHTVMKAIKKKEEQFEMASLITKEYVLSALKRIADDNDEQSQNKLRALENLGRYLSMFTDKQIIQSEQSNPFEGMSDEELAKMYEEQKRFANKG